MRRCHLFPAFREGLYSGVNLAESGNAKWKPHTKLCLVAAAKDDVTTMIEQMNRNVSIGGSRREGVFP